MEDLTIKNKVVRGLLVKFTVTERGRADFYLAEKFAEKRMASKHLHDFEWRVGFSHLAELTLGKNSFVMDADWHCSHSAFQISRKWRITVFSFSFKDVEVCSSLIRTELACLLRQAIVEGGTLTLEMNLKQAISISLRSRGMVLANTKLAGPDVLLKAWQIPFVIERCRRLRFFLHQANLETFTQLEQQ